MSTQRQLNDGERIAGTPYRVIRLIGLGGMGCVYEVEHEELGKRFVLKALLRDLASRDDLAQRMRVEWRALGRLEHPNIVRVSDAGLADGTLPYYVMELLKGMSLSAALKRRGRFPIDEALGIAIGVLDGLAAAHEIGIVHRDVKPPNIFLCTDGVPRLLDFGIAKLIDTNAESITVKGVAVGTPRYMSPEQAAGEPVDTRADLYAIGLVLFEMITGVGPYKAANADELFLAHLTQHAPALSTRVQGIAPELDALVASLLAKAPKERPVSAAACAQSLRAILALRSKPVKLEPERLALGQAPVKLESDPPPISQRELPTVMGDVQQLLNCETRQVSPAKRVEEQNGPPLPKATSSLRLEPIAEASPDRTSEHTLFLSELPLPPDGAASTLTSIAALNATSERQQRRYAAVTKLGRWLFPVAVIGTAAVALVLSSSTPSVEADPVAGAVPRLEETPPLVAESKAVPPVTAVTEPVPVVDAGRLPSSLSGGAKVEDAPVSATVAPKRKPAQSLGKLPDPKDFTASLREPSPNKTRSGPAKSSDKTGSLPPSGL